MTVAELMEILAELPSKWKVVVSVDAEGNSFTPVEGWCDGKYQDGEFDDEHPHPNAVVLWPGG